MSDDAAIRRANLRRISTDPRHFQARAGRSYSYWRDLLADPRKSFGEKAARSIEEALQLPRGWLDAADAGESPQTAAAVSPAREPAPALPTLAQAVVVVLDALRALPRERRAALAADWSALLSAPDSAELRAAVLVALSVADGAATPPPSFATPARPRADALARMAETGDFAGRPPHTSSVATSESQHDPDGHSRTRK